MIDLQNRNAGDYYRMTGVAQVFYIESFPGKT